VKLLSSSPGIEFIDERGLDVHLRKGQQQELETWPRQSVAAWLSNLENRFLPKLDCQLDQMVLYIT